VNGPRPRARIAGRINDRRIQRVSTAAILRSTRSAVGRSASLSTSPSPSVASNFCRRVSPDAYLFFWSSLSWRAPSVVHRSPRWWLWSVSVTTYPLQPASGAKGHTLNTWAYLRNVRWRLADLKPGNLEQLLPDRRHSAMPDVPPAELAAARRFPIRRRLPRDAGSLVPMRVASAWRCRSW
jgi:hypothetical protein